MPKIVYRSATGLSTCVFLMGVGEFQHDVPREVHPRIIGDYLGAVLESGPNAGRYERNVCFAPVPDPTPVAEAAVQEVPQAPEITEEEAHQ